MTRLERRNKILSLFNEGLTSKEIAKKVGLETAGGVNYVLRKYIGKRKTHQRISKETLKQILKEAKKIPSYLLAKKHNYSQSGMNDLIRRNGLTPIKRQPATHCECGKKVHIGIRCRECFNYRHNERYKKHRVSAHRWKHNSYEPSCFLPENWDAQPKPYYRIASV